MKPLVIIVESPGKIKKISKILDTDVIASVGHIFTLKPTLKWFNVDNINPVYVELKNKKKNIKNLKDFSKTHEIVIATDVDREGEGIASNILDLLKLDENTAKRMRFTEITEHSLKNAMRNLGVLDKNLRDSQKARAILDFVFGFELSPFISNELGTYGLSAGRVQTPILYKIFERDNEMKQENLIKKNDIFLVTGENHKFHLKNENTEIDICEMKEKSGMIIEKKSKLESNKPPPPYKTSTLLADVCKRMKLTSKLIMNTLQKLYEQGKITYHRTDSINISASFKKEIVKYIINVYGNNYTKSRILKENEKAHECIRVTDIEKVYEDNSIESRIYNLIRMRTLASQMTDEKYEKNEYVLLYENLHWINIQKKVIFKGFRIIYPDSEKQEILFDKHQKIQTIYNNESATQKIHYFNEQRLIKFMEDNGIGRPSTYASTIEKLLSRGYVHYHDHIYEVSCKNSSKCLEKEKYCENMVKKQFKDLNVLGMTILGKEICEYLEKSNLKFIKDISFTAELEKNLDDVSSGVVNWKDVIKKFYELMKLQMISIGTGFRVSNINWINKLSDTEGVVKTRYGNCFIKIDDIGNKFYAPLPKNKKKITYEDLKNAFENKSILLKECGKYKIYRKKDEYFVMNKSKGKKVTFKSIKNPDEIKSIVDCEKLF